MRILELKDGENVKLFQNMLRKSIYFASLLDLSIFLAYLLYELFFNDYLKAVSSGFLSLDELCYKFDLITVYFYSFLLSIFFYWYLLSN